MELVQLKLRLVKAVEATETWIPITFREYFLISMSPGRKRIPSLSVRLGGQIEEIPPCSTCETSKDTIEPIEPSGYFLTDFHEHTGPYIEIWDKGRNERDINDIGIRALAVPKMRNGRIEKVIVVESGNGYIDPIARVRGIATRHGHYDDGVNRDDHYESRIWMCSNIRETKGGEFVKCGHIEKRDVSSRKLSRRSGRVISCGSDCFSSGNY